MLKVVYVFSIVLIGLAVSALYTENMPADDAAPPSVDIRAIDVQQRAEQIDSVFTYLWKNRGFNGNVLVTFRDSVIYKNTFGYANLDRREPLNIQSVFQLGSVSKQFTSLAVMMLQERGLLQYDDSVQRYIPEFPYSAITIRQLLSHRSGLPNYMYFSVKYWKNKRKFMTNEDLLQMLAEHRPGLEFLPDRRYKYSNTGYAVLASLVERISGMPYDEFLEQNVFSPLHMDQTFVYNPRNRKTIEYETNGYTRNRRRAYDDYLSGVVGDKGVYSTVEDMYRWDQALYTDALVSQATLAEAFNPVSYDRKRHNNYGFGWRIMSLDDGSKIVYHGGWWRGYNSLFVRRLEDHTAFIILTNKVNWSFGDVDELLGLVSPSTL